MHMTGAGMTLFAASFQLLGYIMVRAAAGGRLTPFVAAMSVPFYSDWLGVIFHQVVRTGRPNDAMSWNRKHRIARSPAWTSIRMHD